MPVLVLVSPIRILRNLAGLALTPVVYLATFAGRFYSAILPLMLLAFLAAVWFVHMRRVSETGPVGQDIASSNGRAGFLNIGSATA
jgi:hypothetical protein